MLSVDFVEGVRPAEDHDCEAPPLWIPPDSRVI